MNSLQTFIIDGWFVTSAHTIAEAYANFRAMLED
jgi:hypothetical protein